MEILAPRAPLLHPATATSSPASASVPGTEVHLMAIKSGIG